MRLLPELKDEIEEYYLERDFGTRTIDALVDEEGFPHETSNLDLEVGMVIRLTNNMEIPADCVLLSCSNERGAFVDSSDFDGSATLKRKLPISSTEECSTPDHIADLRCNFEKKKKLHFFVPFLIVLGVFS